MTGHLNQRLRTCAEQSEMGLNFADTPQACREAAAALNAVARANAATHDCYKDFDADAPDTIKDRNGEVVLAACRRCGRGEAQLEDEPCPALAEDAARWRALLNTARIRLLGAANLERDPRNWVHVGLELWSTYPGYTEQDYDRRPRAVEALVALTDDVMGRERRT